MDQNDRETVEDTPEYRSAIVVKSMSAPSLPRSFALPRKLEAHTKAKSSTISASWTVTDLPALPAGYILERSNVYVENESQEVSRRISNFLRLESIAATFDDEEKVRLHKARAVLTNKNFVSNTFSFAESPHS